MAEEKRFFFEASHLSGFIDKVRSRKPACAGEPHADRLEVKRINMPKKYSWPLTKDEVKRKKIEGFFWHLRGFPSRQ